jgi:hypothetical protein
MKFLVILFCVLLLSGCEEAPVPEATEETIIEDIEVTPEPEAETETDLGVSEAVLKELERATKQPRYFEGKKISGGYTIEDYASVTKIEDGDDEFYTYEIITKDGEKLRTSFRKFLVE